MNEHSVSQFNRVAIGRTFATKLAFTLKLTLAPTLALTLTLTLALLHPTPASAAPEPTDVEALMDDTLGDEPLVEDSLITDDPTLKDEAPPKPEYPYPGAEEPGFSKAPQSAEAAPAQPFASERPKRVTEDGEYYYDTKVKEPVPANRSANELPKKTNKAGEFIYDSRSKPHDYKGETGRERPQEIKANGEFTYSTEISDQSASASIRFGIFGVPKIRNSETQVTFEDIYGSGNSPVLLGDYEWRLTSAFGRLGVKFTSGIFVSTGVGKFIKTNPNRRSDDIPEERFTFLMFPNQVTASYKFQYSDTQLFVPYVEGGAGYFTFTEFRDDNKGPKFGGAAVTVAAAGANFLLDWVDARSVRQLDIDYGINHLWLTAELRVIVGLNKDFDFTANVINAGFLTDF